MKKCGYAKLCSESCKRYGIGVNSPCLRGVGNTSATIMLVGEAPGKREDLNSEPFIGPSGKLLNGLLEEAGLDRDDLFITNAVKCATPGENVAPSVSEIKSCKGYLKKEIEIVKPTVVGALGAKAMQALLGRTGITTLKNTPFVSEEFGVKVVPIYHPAYALRNPNAIDDIREGIRVLKEEAGSEDIQSLNKQKTKYILADTEEKIDKVFSVLEKQKEFSFDFETSALNPLAADILTVAFTWKERTGACVVWDKMSKAQKKRLGDILSDTSKRKIAHNIKFELEMCKSHDVPIAPPWDCTMLMHHLLDENNKHGLEPLTLVYTDMGEYWKPLNDYMKEYQKEHKITKDEFSYSTFPMDILAEYNSKDTDATYRLFNIFNERIDQEQLRDLYQNYVLPYTDIVVEMELRGVRCDRDQLKILLDEYTQKEREMEASIFELAQVKDYEEYRKEQAIGDIRKRYDASKVLPSRYPEFQDYVEKSLKEKDYRFNMRSTKQLREILFETPGRKPIKFTDKKSISVDEEVLTKLANEGIDLAETIIRYRKLSKYLSTYIRSTYEKSEFDGRIHADYLQHNTVTGRMASRNPNMQNIPRDAKDFKKCFVAEPGNIFVKADLAQAEFRTWAHYSGDEDMIADIEAGLDIHRRTASEVFGIKEKEVTKDQRTAAKNAVFGMLYGRGSAAIAAQYGISLDEANNVREMFFSRYPKASQWLQKQKLMVQAMGYVKSDLGRIRRLPEIDSENPGVAAEAERQALNSPIQAQASDMNNHYMVTIIRRAREEGLECWPVSTVHDANFIEVKEDHKDRLVEIMKDVVETEFPNFRCKMELDFEIGHSFGTLEEVSV